MSSPTHVLIVGNTYPPHALGGYELLCQDHVGWLRRRGCSVTVLVSRFGVGGRKPIEETGTSGERVIRGLDFHWQDFKLKPPRGLGLIEGEHRQNGLVREVIAETRPEAVQLWHMAAISKSLIRTIVDARTPTIAIVEENWPTWDIESDPWLRLWRHGATRDRILRPGLRRAISRLIAPVDVVDSMDQIRVAYCSDFLREYVEERFEPWRGRGTTIHNGIDIGAMGRTRDPQEPLGRPLRLLYCGRVELRKGVATAVEALAIVRQAGVEAVLDIVGWQDPEFTAVVRAQAQRLEVTDAIRWSDPIDRSKVPDLYRTHDVLLFPTIWEEPFGLVALEAMAAGCIVVGTGSGGSGEIMVDGQTALLHPVEDPRAAASRIRQLTDDPALVAHVRAMGRQMAEEHDIERFHRAVFQLMADHAALPI